MSDDEGFRRDVSEAQALAELDEPEFGYGPDGSPRTRTFVREDDMDGNATMTGWRPTEAWARNTAAFMDRQSPNFTFTYRADGDGGWIVEGTSTWETPPRYYGDGDDDG